MKLSDFIKKYRIKISSVYTDINPNMKDSKNMDNWNTTLKFRGRQYTFYFSQGYGFKCKEPELDTVLSNFLADSSYVNISMEEFADEFGYDCRTGRMIYNNIIKQDERLQRLFGEEIYNIFIKVEDD